MGQSVVIVLLIPLHIVSILPPALPIGGPVLRLNLQHTCRLASCSATVVAMRIACGPMQSITIITTIVVIILDIDYYSTLYETGGRGMHIWGGSFLV